MCRQEGTMSGNPSIVVIAGKRVARAEFIRSFRQRGMNLIIESAHKAPPSNTIPEIVGGLDRAKTMLCMVHAVDTGASSATIALEVNGDEMEVAVPKNLEREVELAFRYNWVKQLEPA
jgi:hypothetical protein